MSTSQLASRTRCCVAAAPGKINLQCCHWSQGERTAVEVLSGLQQLCRDALTTAEVRLAGGWDSAARGETQGMMLCEASMVQPHPSPMT